MRHDEVVGKAGNGTVRVSIAELALPLRERVSAPIFALQDIRKNCVVRVRVVVSLCLRKRALRFKIFSR